jgi:hypothetical protein
MTKRFLTCSCCGGDAGEFEHWPNRDKGYGLCADCVVWLRKPREATGQPRMSEADIARNYGVAGRNFAKPESRFS